jgi:DNA-binding transcriptional MerR regulator
MKKEDIKYLLEQGFTLDEIKELNVDSKESETKTSESKESETKTSESKETTFDDMMKSFSESMDKFRDEVHSMNIKFANMKDDEKQKNMTDIIGQIIAPSKPNKEE